MWHQRLLMLCWYLLVAAERMQGAAKVVVNLRPKYARRADRWVREVRFCKLARRICLTRPSSLVAPISLLNMHESNTCSQLTPLYTHIKHMLSNKQEATCCRGGHFACTS